MGRLGGAVWAEQNGARTKARERTNENLRMVFFLFSQLKPQLWREEEVYTADGYVEQGAWKGLKTGGYERPEVRFPTLAAKTRTRRGWGIHIWIGWK